MIVPLRNEIKVAACNTRSTLKAKVIVETPLVVIPVFPGTNCEYDSKRAFEKAGAKVQLVLIRNKTEQMLTDSINELETAIRQANIVMLPGGFSAGDEPEGSGKFIATVLKNPRLKDAISDLLDNRDGLMIGILGYRRDWEILSNRESGDGFSDILIETTEPENEIGVVIELKYSSDEKNLDTDCRGALQQIEDKNYVQELCEKYENISKPVHWHMIGHLQTNKVKYIIDKVELIHSVDSLHLAKQIEKEAVKKGVDAQILVQVNIAQEDTKFGIDGPEVMSLVEEISKFPHVHIRGLMTSAPFVANPEENRCYFKKLHKLFVDIREKNIDNVSMDILSMGMTNDYEVAIEEGATMVRVGTGIFGARNYNK